jgi:hypothetical protein
VGLFLLALGEARGQTPGDNPWTLVEVDREDFPEDFIPPADFVALTLDQSLLEELLADAPRESFGQVPSDVFVPLPLPDETFAVGGVASSSLMEPALAAQFPEIQTWVFHDLVSGSSGHLALGPGGFFAALRTVGKLVKIEPVETDVGLVYLCYEDALRRDGANEIHFPPGEHDHDDPPLPVPVAALESPQVEQVTSGGQLRVYRLAAATTGELYQARGGNDLSVLFSIVVDVLGANAVFEPEVATRLIIALASLDVFYSNPATDPFFNGPPVCSINGNACTSDDDCDTDNGETCSIRTTCGLRDDNRDNMIALHNNATIDHSEYDLSVLTAVSRPGVRGGCAWYVVCLEGNTDHKARGMVTAGTGGTGSTSGVLAHEVGHMLGARHTFTGQDGSCTVGEFFAGDSESGYEPGSGTTRMSYNGNCDSDNVDISADPPSDQYFHSRSFDEIVENVFNGDGADCGSLVNTGNLPPQVDAGPDYAIPRMTPFLLSPASYSDQQMAALTFNWEQYDRAIVQRPIDTDFVIFFGVDFGPIIRSVAPVPEPNRTVPNLTDLLDGTSQPPSSINRAGEMLPQVDRTLDFRFIARDNEMGGGGVAYDDITLTVEGDPFYLTTPNGGESLNAGCTAVATWEVGGSDVPPVSAANVDLSFSEDGGVSFSPLVAATPNDGGQAYAVECTSTSTARLKAQGTGNIFFDISDADFSVVSQTPQISGSATGGAVDEQCEFEVTFEATVTDDCGVATGDVEVEVTETTGNATLGAPIVNISQNGATTVDVSGSVLVSDLTTSPAQVRIGIEAEDNCGLTDSEVLLADVSDTTPPAIEVVLDPDVLWPPNHKMKAITAEVTAADNCGVVSFVLDSVTSDEPDDATGDGKFINDVQGAMPGTADLSFQLRAERMGSGDGRIYTATYTATDGSDNEASDSDEVQVPASQKPSGG